MGNDTDNTPIGIDYEVLVEEALREVVKSALKIAEKDGLPNDTHFYISFKTHFGVTLSFSGVKQSLIVPFAAITHFTDPSVGFGLQFSAGTENASSELSEVIASIEDKNKKDINRTKTKSTADVVSLDSFRKQPSSPS